MKNQEPAETWRILQIYVSSLREAAESVYIPEILREGNPGAASSSCCGPGLLHVPVSYLTCVTCVTCVTCAVLLTCCGCLPDTTGDNGLTCSNCRSETRQSLFILYIMFICYVRWCTVKRSVLEMQPPSGCLFCIITSLHGYSLKKPCNAAMDQSGLTRVIIPHRLCLYRRRWMVRWVWWWWRWCYSRYDIHELFQPGTVVKSFH